MTPEELFDNRPGDLIATLISDTIRKDAVDIRFEFEENEQWSTVSTFRDDDDSEVSLRLHSGNKFFLYFGYYDTQDEFHERVTALTPDQVVTIPTALTKLMAKVLDDEQGMRVPGNVLKL